RETGRPPRCDAATREASLLRPASMKESPASLEDWFLAMFGQLAQQALGGLVEFRGHVDHQVHVKVTASPPVEVFDALVSESVHGAVRAARDHVDRHGLSQCRYFDGRPQDGLGEGDVGFVVEIVAVAFEAVVVLHAQVHEETTVRSSAKTGRTTVAQSHRRAVFDTGRHLDRERRRLVASAVTATVRARRVDARAHAVTAGTGHRRHHLAEDRVSDSLDDTDARTFDTGRGRGTRSATRSVTRRTAVREGDGDFTRRPEGRVIERYIQGDLGGRSRLGSATLLTVSAQSPEEHVEDVLDRTGPEGIATGADVRTEAVVVRAPFGVREDLVGLGDLLEARFGRGVVVGIGVVLARESPVGLLQVFLGRVVI